MSESPEERVARQVRADRAKRAAEEKEITDALLADLERGAS